jgi:hypothetical protein
VGCAAALEAGTTTAKALSSGDIARLGQQRVNNSCGVCAPKSPCSATCAPVQISLDRRDLDPRRATDPQPLKLFRGS